MTKVSDGSNLINDEHGRFYPKGRAVELQWYANADIGEEIRFTIETIHKTKFNLYVET